MFCVEWDLQADQNDEQRENRNKVIFYRNIYFSFISYFN